MSVHTNRLISLQKNIYEEYYITELLSKNYFLKVSSSSMYGFLEGSVLVTA